MGRFDRLTVTVGPDTVEVDTKEAAGRTEVVVTYQAVELARWRSPSPTIGVAFDPGHVCVWAGIAAVDISFGSAAAEVRRFHEDVLGVQAVAEGAWLVVAESTLEIWTPHVASPEPISFGDVIVRYRVEDGNVYLDFLEGEQAKVRVGHSMESGLTLMLEELRRGSR